MDSFFVSAQRPAVRSVLPKRRTYFDPQYPLLPGILRMLLPAKRPALARTGVHMLAEPRPQPQPPGPQPTPAQEEPAAPTKVLAGRRRIEV